MLTGMNRANRQAYREARTATMALLREMRRQPDGGAAMAQRYVRRAPEVHLHQHTHHHTVTVNAPELHQHLHLDAATAAQLAGEVAPGRAQRALSAAPVRPAIAPRVVVGQLAAGHDQAEMTR